MLRFRRYAFTMPPWQDDDDYVMMIMLPRLRASILFSRRHYSDILLRWLRHA